MTYYLVDINENVTEYVHCVVYVAAGPDIRGGSYIALSSKTLYDIDAPACRDNYFYLVRNVDTADCCAMMLRGVIAEVDSKYTLSPHISTKLSAKLK